MRTYDELSCTFGAECRLENGEANCVCPNDCGPEMDQVCGTDRTTYGSECQLKLWACRQQKYIDVLHEGPCELGLEQFGYVLDLYFMVNFKKFNLKKHENK